MLTIDTKVRHHAGAVHCKVAKKALCTKMTDGERQSNRPCQSLLFRQPVPRGCGVCRRARAPRRRSRSSSISRRLGEPRALRRGPPHVPRACEERGCLLPDGRGASAVGNRQSSSVGRARGSVGNHRRSGFFSFCLGDTSERTLFVFFPQRATKRDRRLGRSVVASYLTTAR
jgi:hypothetical protein